VFVFRGYLSRVKKLRKSRKNFVSNTCHSWVFAYSKDCTSLQISGGTAWSFTAWLITSLRLPLPLVLLPDTPGSVPPSPLNAVLACSLDPNKDVEAVVGTAEEAPVNLNQTSARRSQPRHLNMALAGAYQR